MRQFFSFLLISFLSFTLPIFSDTNWESSIQSAMTRSKLEKKPILIDLYADWCTYCKILEKEIFPDPEVAKLLESFVTVRLDGEEYPNLRKKYGVEGYPTILFIDSETNYLNKISGLATKPMVMRVAKLVLAEPDIEVSLKNTLEKNPESALTYFRLGTLYYQRKDFPSAKNQFLAAIRFAKNNEQKIKEDSSFNLGIIYIQETAWSQAIEIWKSFIASYPKSNNFNSANIYYGISLKEAGERKLASHILQSVRPKLTDLEDIETVDQTLEEIRKGF